MSQRALAEGGATTRDSEGGDVHNLLFQHNGDWIWCQQSSWREGCAAGLRKRAEFATLSGKGASQQWGCAMRLRILALLLSSGTAACCQTAAPSPANPQQHFLTPPAIAQPGRDFGRLPPNWHFDSAVPQKTILLRDAGAAGLGEPAEIDPKMIVRPPQSSLGEQPPGTQLAQNLYPGLQLLPIEESKAKAEPIQITWPNLKVEQIPIVWPKLEIKAMESGAAGH